MNLWEEDQEREGEEKEGYTRPVGSLVLTPSPSRAGGSLADP